MNEEGQPLGPTSEFAKRSVSDTTQSLSRAFLKGLDFGTAMVHLRHGQYIKRAGWQGHWFLVKNVHCQCPSPVDANYSRCFDFKEIIVAVLRENGGCTPAQPYQQDLLAHDWEVIDFHENQNPDYQ